MPYKKHYPRPPVPKVGVPSQSVGVTWYTKEEWAKVKARAADAEVFEATYEEWVAMVEKAMVDLQAVGLKLEKVFVSADELTAWCIAHGKPNNGESRSQYVAEWGRAQAGKRR